VIPELFWAPAYDAKHQVSSRSVRRTFTSKVRKGVRDRLLCRECETRFGQHETYVSRIWCGNASFPTRIALGSELVRQVDYYSFKLLHLSILWRAHEASLPEFDDTDLGPYAEELRRYLYEDRAPGSDVFAVAAQVVVDPKTSRIMHDMIAPPTPYRLNGKRLYVSIYGGCLWYIGVSPGALAGDSFVLKQDGRFIAPAISIAQLPGVAKLLVR
jgi:hypothetical protein